jgi:arylsulfatase A-like enzyme
MDDAIGQILAVLERKKLRDNTLVIFFGDNGAHGPSDNQGGAYPGEYERVQVGNTNVPLQGHKSSVYEGGIRTPGLVCWPGKLPVSEVQTPLAAVDWMPTLCALAGAKPAGDLKWDGIDIWPVLSQSAATPPARTIYSAAPGFRAQMVRHGDWKLIVTPTDGKKGKAAQKELFNLASDLGESKNLAVQMPEKVAEMKQRLAEISRRDRDAVAND